MKCLFKTKQMGLILILCIGLPMHTAMALRVACVGDSHTYSGGTSVPDVSYPAQLETILKQLNPEWETKNFGVSGATVLEQGNLPYIHQADYTFPWKWCLDPNAYELALAYEPDVVVFQFGSNATMNLKNIGLIDEHFLADYNALIQTFDELPSKPMIVICQPPPMFDPMYSPCATILKEQIVPLVTEVAAAWHAPVVDFYTAFQDLRHLYKADQMHVTAAGAKIMADMVAEAILRMTVGPDLNGDGIVDTLDMHIMVDHWGRDDSACDIAPAPSGDGIVDIQDMMALAEFMEPVDTRLIMRLRLDEACGDVTNDSALEYDGILNGNPMWMPADGISGGALQFDGMDDYIAGPFVLDPTKGPLSFCAWVKTSEVGQVIVSQAGAMNDWLSIDSSGRLTTGLSYPSSILTSTSGISDDTWHHIGLVSDDSGKCLYIDGVEAATDKALPILPSNGSLHIGVGKELDPDSFFTGMMDDIRIYNVALEPSEIAELAK
ncbi:MAG: hypothetical protein K9N55_05310 [Phycisphaerae bacterium]|nr:hypothetical protein [Phycisphaerae bacterium]